MSAPAGDGTPAPLSAYRETPEGVRIALRVTTGASANAVGEERDGALQVKVTAPPEDGKANAAVIKLLAKHWRVPSSAIRVVGGAIKRNKTLLVAGYSLDELIRAMAPD